MTSQTEDSQTTILVRSLGRREYVGVWDLMKNFTDNRDESTKDELWFVEHDPVFTQGLAGKAEHILAPGDIPVVQVDRGGQVTYHGPGQQVVYIMVNLRRQNLGVRQLVTAIENGIIGLLNTYQIKSAARADAPGVYMLSGEKICSIGLRIRKGCSFHGLALNVNPDIEPFGRINPCGYSGLQITSMKLQNGPSDLDVIKEELASSLAHSLGYEKWSEVTTPLSF